MSVLVDICPFNVSHHSKTKTRVKRSSQLSLPPQLNSGNAILLHKIIVLQVGDLPLEIGDRDGLLLVLPSQFSKEFLPGLVIQVDLIFLNVGHVHSVSLQCLWVSRTAHDRSKSKDLIIIILDKNTKSNILFVP